MRNKLFLILSVIILLVILIGLFSDKFNIKNDSTNLNVECKTDNDCVKAGCSGELCTFKGDNARTACLYLPEYECLGSLPCLCINNKCEFQENDQHLNCLDNIKR
ncbi:MAG: eight-cysteine-cluster domain-containing protein [Nanoarchaeota archaeon]